MSEAMKTARELEDLGNSSDETQEIIHQINHNGVGSDRSASDIKFDISHVDSVPRDGSMRTGSGQAKSYVQEAVCTYC
jgi:hypothetical protein